MWIATAVGQQLTHFVDCAKQDGAVVVERHRGRKAPFSIIKPAFPCSLTCRGCLGQVEEQRVLRDPWLSLHPGHSKSAHRGWCVDVAPPGAKGRGGGREEAHKLGQPAEGQPAPLLVRRAVQQQLSQDERQWKRKQKAVSCLSSSSTVFYKTKGSGNASERQCLIPV